MLKTSEVSKKLMAVFSVTLPVAPLLSSVGETFLRELETRDIWTKKLEVLQRELDVKCQPIYSQRKVNLWIAA